MASTESPAAAAAAPAVKKAPPATAKSRSTATARPVAQTPTALSALAQRDATFWLRESLCLIVGLLCLAGIVIVMVVFQNQPIPHWPAKITINSLVSTLATVMKLALAFCIVQCFDELKWRLSHRVEEKAELKAFDTAARGPWGAVLLIIKRYGKLASLGAVIVLLSVAIDPFIQQTVQPQDCALPVTGNGVSIARTNRYTGVTTALPNQVETYDGPLTRAIYQGFLSPPTNATSELRFTCPTGNCTYGGSDGTLAYTSLALCAYVDDLSSQVTTGFSATDNTTMSWYLPSYGVNSTNITVNGRDAMLASAVYSHAYGQFDPQNAAFSFEVLMASSDTNTSFAFGAYLWPCVQQYTQSSTLNGTLHEAKTSATPVPLNYLNPAAPSMDHSDFYGLAGDFPSFPGVDCTGVPTPQGNKTALAIPATGGGYVYQDPLTAPASVAGSLYFDPACTYLVDSNPLASLASAAPKFFGDQFSVIANGDGGEALWLVDLYMSAPPNEWNVTMAETWLEGVTNSVTAYWRANAQDPHTAPNEYAPGTMFSETTCVRIVWPWVALPAAAVGLTLILLLGTIVAIKLAGNGRARRTKASDAHWTRFTNGMQGVATNMGTKAMGEAVGDHAGNGIAKAAEALVSEVLR